MYRVRKQKLLIHSDSAILCVSDDFSSCYTSFGTQISWVQRMSSGRRARALRAGGLMPAPSADIDNLRRKLRTKTVEAAPPATSVQIVV